MQHFFHKGMRTCESKDKHFLLTNNKQRSILSGKNECELSDVLLAWQRSDVGL